MNDEKKWYQSTGVLGALAAIGGTLGGFVGLNIDAGATADIVSLGERIYDSVMQIIALGGAVLALWGRLRASKKIK